MLLDKTRHPPRNEVFHSSVTLAAPSCVRLAPLDGSSTPLHHAESVSLRRKKQRGTVRAHYFFDSLIFLMSSSEIVVIGNGLSLPSEGGKKKQKKKKTLIRKKNRKKTHTIPEPQPLSSSRCLSLMSLPCN